MDIQAEGTVGTQAADTEEGQAADTEDILEVGTEEARAADTEEEGVVVIGAANVVIMEGVGGVALMKRRWKKGTDHHVL